MGIGDSRLRPFIPSDAGRYLYFATDRRASIGWRHRGTTPHADQLLNSLWTGAEVVLVGTSGDDVVGFFVLYDVDYRHSRGYVAVLQDPSIEGVGGSFGPLSQFLDYVFGEFPVGKLYFVSDETAAASYASAVASGLLVEEACFRRHFQYETNVWSDCYVCTLWRDAWVRSKFSELSE